MYEKFKKSEKFRYDRFGMFIHFGIYSISGRGEWYRSDAKLPMENDQQYFEMFNPYKYDPKDWARKAKEAGMKYIVLTTKHHDGFCLFDTKFTNFNSVRACGRDLVKEFVEAVRSEGLQVGLYYSIIDWRHKDYPKYGDMYHPMRENEKYKNEKVNFSNYLKFMHGQVKELVTNYGKIDILWFDYSYGDLRGDAWEATKLIKMVRKYQPDVIMDNRLETSGEGFGSLATAHPNEYSGDFVGPEQIIPPEGIRNELGEPIPWELCCTMNNNWGFNAADHLYKSSKMLIRKLVECVSKGGNMILNVGPNAYGEFPDESLKILKEIGDWMSKNSESIYGCGYAEIPKPEWGRYTRKGNILYAHVLEAPLGPLALTGIDPKKIKSCTILESGVEMRAGDSFVTKEYGGIAFVSFGDIPYFTYPIPNEVDTVLKIILKD